VTDQPTTLAGDEPQPGLQPVTPGFPTPARRDFAVPFRVDPASRQVSVTSLPAHIGQMVRQVLLTAPGERVNLPQFGCGLRQLIFAPATDALQATLQIRIQANLQQWLGNQIDVTAVSLTLDSAGPGTVQVTVAYRLIDTQTAQRLTVTVM